MTEVSQNAVVWFRTRKDDKDGPNIDNGGRGFTVPGDPTLGVFPLGLLPSTTPTARQLKRELFLRRWRNVDVYNRHRDDNPLDNSDIVDLTKHGLTRATPLLFVDFNDDSEEQQEEEEEKEEVQGRPISQLVTRC